MNEQTAIELMNGIRIGDIITAEQWEAVVYAINLLRVMQAESTKRKRDKIKNFCFEIYLCKRCPFMNNFKCTANWQSATEDELDNMLKKIEEYRNERCVKL